MFASLRVGYSVPVVFLACLVVMICPLSETASGQPPAVEFSGKLLLISPNEGCAVGDVNKDGNLDVVAGTNWFAGPDFVGRPLRDIEEFNADYLCNNADCLYDVDKDGWLDVISGHWMATEINWFKNPGKVGLEKGLKWEQALLKDTRDKNEINELRDLDGDGVPEWFVNSWSKEDNVVCWKFATDAEGKPTLEEVIIGADGGGHGYAFGDINGDGREDLLVETGWYERPQGAPFAKPWKFHPETALPHPSCPCVIVDLNGDDRNDIIWGKAHDFGLYWWEQGEPKADGTTTWTEHLIDDTWSQVHSLVWADLNGDGQPELITGKRVRGHAGRDPGGKDPECLFYYCWDKTAKEFTRHDVAPVGSGVGAGMQICVADLNGDDRPDIAVSGKTGTWVLLNEGSK
jgi:hypothetical protein